MGISLLSGVGANSYSKYHMCRTFKCLEMIYCIVDRVFLRYLSTLSVGQSHSLKLISNMTVVSVCHGVLSSSFIKFIILFFSKLIRNDSGFNLWEYIYIILLLAIKLLGVLLFFRGSVIQSRLLFLFVLFMFLDSILVSAYSCYRLGYVQNVFICLENVRSSNSISDIILRRSMAIRVLITGLTLFCVSVSFVYIGNILGNLNLIHLGLLCDVFMHISSVPFRLFGGVSEQIYSLYGGRFLFPSYNSVYKFFVGGCDKAGSYSFIKKYVLDINSRVDYLIRDKWTMVDKNIEGLLCRYDNIITIDIDDLKYRKICDCFKVIRGLCKSAELAICELHSIYGCLLEHLHKIKNLFACPGSYVCECRDIKEECRSVFMCKYLVNLENIKRSVPYNISSNDIEDKFIDTNMCACGLVTYSGILYSSLRLYYKASNSIDYIEEAISFVDKHINNLYEDINSL